MKRLEERKLSDVSRYTQDQDFVKGLMGILLTGGGITRFGGLVA
jgi:hypothetical protein